MASQYVYADNNDVTRFTTLIANFTITERYVRKFPVSLTTTTPLCGTTDIASHKQEAAYSGNNCQPMPCPTVSITCV